MLDYVSRAAARRAALCASLVANEPVSGAQSRYGAVVLDGYVALLDAADSTAVELPALALAAAEGDAATSAVARVLLGARALLGEDERDSRNAAAPDDEIIAICRLVGAAASQDDETVIRFLTSRFVGLDVAHVRGAANARPSEPLRTALGQALDSFPGNSQREAAARAAIALRRVSDAIADDAATIETTVRAGSPAGESARDLYLAARRADAVWNKASQKIPLRERVRVFVDALLRPTASGASWPIDAPNFIDAAVSRVNQPSDDDRVRAREPQEVWEWPVPEPERQVVAQPMTFSASRLNAFVKCGRRWFYEYLCAAVEDEGSIQATYGRVLHEALESLHRRVPDLSAVQEPAILALLLTEIDAAFDRSRNAFATAWEHEVSRRQARQIAPRYVEWLLAQSKTAPTRIVALESVHRLRAGGHDFIGYIDRIDEPIGGGPVTIYDYKTGKMAEDAGAYLAAVRDGDEAQLPLYYYMCRSRGSDVGRVALVSVRDPQAGIRVLALDIVDDQAEPMSARRSTAACSKADLDAALTALLARCDLLTQTGIGHFAPGQDPPCGYCAYAPACREKPRTKESIFAR